MPTLKLSLDRQSVAQALGDPSRLASSTAALVDGGIDLGLQLVERPCEFRCVELGRDAALGTVEYLVRLDPPDRPSKNEAA